MGGGGTRFLNSAVMPKPLIDLQGKPFFYWATKSLLFDELTQDVTYVVLQEHIDNYNIDKKILKYFPDAKIIALPHILNGAVLTSIEGVRDICDDLPVIFNDCDHAFTSEQLRAFLQNIDDEVYGAFVTFQSNEPKFSYIRYDEQGNIIGTIEKEVVSSDAICGAYYFKNKTVFEKYAASYLNNCAYKEFFMSGVYNELCRDGKTLAKFDTDVHLSFGTPDEYLEIKDSHEFQRLDKDIEDFEVIQDVSSGSYARSFYIEKNGKYYYRKLTTPRTGGSDKLRAQLEFLIKYGEELKMPTISRYGADEKNCYFDMLSNDTHESLFKRLQYDDRNAWECLQSILTILSNFHKKHQRELDVQALSKYVKTKVFGNVEFIKKNGGELISELLKYETLVINDVRYRNLDYYFADNGILSYDTMMGFFKNDDCSVIHGDFTIDNIIYDETVEGKSYLIDPNVMNLHECPLLDYSKMLQSLHGNYEYYATVTDFTVSGNVIKYNLGNTSPFGKLYAKYDEYLKNNFTQEQYRAIYAHELVHWLRLMPYKINKNPKTATLYFAQLIINLNNFEKSLR